MKLWKAVAVPVMCIHLTCIHITWIHSYWLIHLDTPHSLVWFGKGQWQLESRSAVCMSCSSSLLGETVIMALLCMCMCLKWNCTTLQRILNGVRSKPVEQKKKKICHTQVLPSHSASRIMLTEEKIGKFSDGNGHNMRELQKSQPRVEVSMLHPYWMS